MIGRLYELCKGIECPPEVSATYRRLWDAVSRPPCMHLGELTGRHVHCRTCKNTVQIKTRYCAIHGTCTTITPVEHLACCRLCQNFTPRNEANGSAAAV